MPHSIVHIEIPSTDFGKSKAFYEALFGWQVQLMPEMNYAMWNPGEGVSGGFVKWDRVSTDKEVTLAYVSVTDIEAMTRKAESLGAHVVMQKQEVPTMGWFVVLADPCGAPIALWESMKK